VEIEERQAASVIVYRGGREKVEGWGGYFTLGGVMSDGSGIESDGFMRDGLLGSISNDCLAS
jgi:hypothetical protein